MIQFKQKEFVGPLLAAMGGPIGAGLMIGGTGVSAIQGHNANKQQAVANQIAQEQQAKQNKIMAKEEKARTEAYEKSLKDAAKNGVSAPPMQGNFSETKIILKRKTFANATIFKPVEKLANGIFDSGTWRKFKGTNTYKNARGFASDLRKVGEERGSGTKISDMVGMGLTMAGGGYLVNRAIQHDMKKNGNPIQTTNNSEDKKSSIGKTLKTGVIGAGTLGSTLILARKGKLNGTTFKNAGKRAISGIKGQFITQGQTGKQLENSLRKEELLAKKRGAPLTPEQLAAKREELQSGGKFNALGTGLTTVFVGMPAVTYLSQRKQKNDQIAQSQQEFSSTEEDTSNGTFKRAAVATLGTVGAIGGTFALARRGKLNRLGISGRTENMLYAKVGKKLGNNNMVNDAKKRWVDANISKKVSTEAPQEFINNKRNVYNNVFDKSLNDKKYVRKTLKKAGNAIINVPAGFFGFGRDNRRELQSQLNNAGNKSNNKWTKTAAKIVNPKNMVLGAGVGVALGAVSFKPMELSESATKKSIGIVDKNAYGYEKSQEQSVN